MLDDLKYIAKVDAQDALGVATKQAEQLQQGYQTKVEAKAEIRNIVFSGMGGSALPVTMLASWPGVSVPYEISRGYDIPEFVDEHTLFVSMSFSGNTEETLSSFQKALEKSAQVVVMASGGKLAGLAQAHSLPLFELPTGLQPRMSSLYFLSALIHLLEPLGLVKAGSLQALQLAGEWLAEQHNSWLPEVATEENPAKQIAKQLMGKTVILYGGPLLFPAANKWKIFINECAKNLAWSNQYPEFNHNEFIGWSSHPVEKPFAVVELQSNLEHPRVQKRFELSQKLLSGKRPHPIIIRPEGDSVLKQLLWAFNLGDFVSIYLAILNNVDPTPVDLVEKLKTELS